jgi:hypothetical protein
MDWRCYNEVRAKQYTPIYELHISKKIEPYVY